ncbi:dihydroorotase [Vibrio litoralis]|jgi:dihydroorotase|uniref:dihydroorotase n=1 Tax=Vibrio litoralis TaxID=335972 RepID=UPI0018663860|nr:dihydroorotase [Vibrio litoralis]
MMDKITIRKPDDFHLHLRDSEMLKMVLPYSEQHFSRAVVMPNLKQPVVSLSDLAKYREQIISSLRAESDFTPLMTLYLCDDLTTDTIQQAYDLKLVSAIKLYPAGATTHSQHGVTSVDKVSNKLELMQELGIPLLIHGENACSDVDPFDRERVFIDKTLFTIREQFPELKIVLEHITTEDAVSFIDSQDARWTAATITPHHLLFNRGELFKGGLHPHYYCLPLLKREHHRLRLVKAATSGDSRFFAGTDSAPHPSKAKLSSCGCAGLFNAPFAISTYATIFDKAGQLINLEKFLSLNGAKFYGLQPNQQEIVLRKLPPEPIRPIYLSDGDHIEVFAPIEQLEWRVDKC